MLKIMKIKDEDFEKIESEAIKISNMNCCRFSEGSLGFRISRRKNCFKVIYFNSYTDENFWGKDALRLEFTGRLLKYKNNSYFIASLTYQLKYWVWSLAFLIFSIVPIHEFQIQGVIVWMIFNLLIAFLVRKEYKQLTYFAEKVLQNDEQ